MHIKSQTRKLHILLLSFLTIFLTACSNPALLPEAATLTTLPEETTAQTLKPEETTQAETTSPSPDEAVLIDIMQKACGSDLETYLYLDMDHDGQKELLGSFVSDNNGYYQIWYCSSDKTVCEAVLYYGMVFYGCSIKAIEYGHETHAIVNTYNMFGPEKSYSILALQDSEIQYLAKIEYGNAGLDDEGRIYLTVDAYDAGYDLDFQTTSGHTWKRTYLTYDEEANAYREYTAKEISEEEFLKLKNAKECLETIRTENADAENLELSFFIRKNGILYVQCTAYHTINRHIDYDYYTMHYQDDTILDAPGKKNEGRMYERFSSLEAAE